MFEDILSKKDLSFKDLEEFCFKFACDLAKELLKLLLEKYDEKLLKSRNKDEDMLKAGEKETPIIYQEADGIMIYLQGEERKKSIKYWLQNQ